MESHHPSSCVAVFKAEHATYDDGQPVLTTSIGIDEDAPLDGVLAGGFSQGDVEDIVRRAQQETALRIFQDLFDGDPTPKELHRRAALRWYLLKPEGTQADLAERLGCTPGLISQRLNKLQAKAQ
jgi:hypothetical protein